MILILATGKNCNWVIYIAKHFKFELQVWFKTVAHMQNYSENLLLETVISFIMDRGSAE